MKDKFVEEYIINPCTMLIVPQVYGRKIYSKIYELEEEILAPFKPLEIIKASCEFFCSSYEGRIEGSYCLIGRTHKAPISINPTLFFFPTSSPSRQDCLWVNDQHVLNYRRQISKGTKATFRNKETYDIPISVRAFGNQLLRTSFLRDKLTQRTNETERRNWIYLYNPKYISASENSEEYGRFMKKKPPHFSE